MHGCSGGYSWIGECAPYTLASYDTFVNLRKYFFSTIMFSTANAILWEIRRCLRRQPGILEDLRSLSLSACTVNLDVHRGPSEAAFNTLRPPQQSNVQSALREIDGEDDAGFPSPISVLLNNFIDIRSKIHTILPATLWGKKVGSFCIQAKRHQTRVRRHALMYTLCTILASRWSSWSKSSRRDWRTMVCLRSLFKSL